jgi:hypothetical protein
MEAKTNDSLRFAAFHQSQFVKIPQPMASDLFLKHGTMHARQDGADFGRTL